jgi:putative transposase
MAGNLPEVLEGREMTVNNEFIDRLLGYKKPEDSPVGENGLLKQLTKRLVERALEAEDVRAPGHDKNKPVANPRGNTRNGKSKKTLEGRIWRTAHRHPAIVTVF